MNQPKKVLFCLLIFYIFLNIISLPMLFLMGDFKDGFINVQQNFLIVAFTIFLLIFIFLALKIKKTRFAIIAAFLIQYLIAFGGNIFSSDPLLIDGFFISSYLLNPLSFYIFRLLPLTHGVNFVLLKLFPTATSFNLIFVVILLLIFNIFCWYFLGRLIEKLLLKPKE